MNETNAERSIRFLFLGSYTTDRRIKNFLRAFSEHGYKTELLFAEPGVRISEVFFDGDISITRLPLRFSSGPLMFLEYHRRMQGALRDLNRTSIITASELYSLRAASSAKRHHRADRLLYDARELYTALPAVENSPAKRSFWKFWEYQGLKRTDAVIVTAPDDADAICKVHSTLPRSFLVRNLPARSDLGTRGDYLRKTYPQIGSRRILVYAGGLSADRGLPEVIEAMKQLNDRYAFVIIGSGKLESTLHKNITEYDLTNDVMVHSAVHSDELLPIIASADIGISLIDPRSTSYALGLPSKIFEYMQAGLPVVSTPLKQVVDLFGTDPAIRYSGLGTDEIVSSLSSLSLPNESERQMLSHRMNEQYTFDKEIRSLLAYLDR